MKPIKIIAVMIPLLLVSCNSGGESTLTGAGSPEHEFWVTLEEAQERAYDEGQHMLLDIYTEWCGFCRRMNAETYADEGVQELLDRYFIATRINAESSQSVTFLGRSYTMEELALQFGVASYPTTVFLTPNGEPLAAQAGFFEAPHFRQMLGYVGTGSYQEVTFEEYSNTQ
ncbi:DUF255 domain-containing protein [Balneolales bacterium ANBcel1]|nr:DUF255 domain-containing protein [Balneolales bacterium ANBcel1]